ncbi:unnamed protein product, partial [Prorocentrum cordatum]
GNSTEQQIADVMKQSAVSKARPNREKKEHVLIVYDAKQSGESMTAPHDRVAPFRSAHYSKLISAVLKMRGDTENLSDGDVFLVYDAFRHGNEGEIGRCFKKLSDGKQIEKQKRTMYFMYDQDSLAQHRGLTRGGTVIHQCEFLHLFTAAPLDLGEDRDRRYYKGTNKGDTVGPIAMPASADMWHLSFTAKKECYASH